MSNWLLAILSSLTASLLGPFNTVTRIIFQKNLSRIPLLTGPTQMSLEDSFIPVQVKPITLSLFRFSRALHTLVLQLSYYIEVRSWFAWLSKEAEWEFSQRRLCLSHPPKSSSIRSNIEQILVLSNLMSNYWISVNKITYCSPVILLNKIRI